MVTTELGACEWFIWDLRRSNLIERGQLDQVVGDFMQNNPRAEPPALAQYLVQQGTLSQFQAERLLQGKTQGFVLGPFTLMDSLGAGSMGTVYKAQSKNDNKTYAVKVLPRRSMWNVRVARRKVRAFEACRHPSVVPFIDVGTAGGLHYLAWPFVQGQGLDKVVQSQGKLSPGLAAYYALQVAQALDVCHQQALFHGLLKPSNLLVSEHGQVYILDLGIGCLLAETEGESLVDTMSTANSVASGLDCASPESIMDPTNLTPAGDQYSLGCVLYYCLTGQYPFADGSSAEKMMAHQLKEPTPIHELSPDVPDELVEVVQRLMQKAPDKRFQNAEAVVEVLQPLSEVPPEAVALTPPPPQNMGGSDHGHSAEMRSLASAGNGRASSIGPSTQTPRPQASLALPTRQSVLSSAPPPAPARPATEKTEELPETPKDKVVAQLSWDEIINRVGIAALAVAVCFAAWAFMTFVF